MACPKTAFCQILHRIDRGIDIEQILAREIKENRELRNDTRDLHSDHGFTTLTLMLVTCIFFSSFRALAF
jgi:hypothetical protein